MEKIQRCCSVCSKSFSLYESVLRVRSALYCSRECFHEAMLEKRKGSDNGNAKLLDEEVIDIRSMLRTGSTGKEMAWVYKVSQSTISSIKHRKSWAHLS